MTITELYNKALSRGVLEQGTTEAQFIASIKDEDGLKQFYKDATESGKMRFHPYDEFKERIGYNSLGEAKISPAPAVLPAVQDAIDKAQGVQPDTPQEQDKPANLVEKSAGQDVDYATLPEVKSVVAQAQENAPVQHQGVNYEEMSLEEISALYNSLMSQANEIKQKQVADAKEWEDSHPAMSAMVAQSNQGRTTSQVLEEAGIGTFVEDKETYNKVKDELGKRLYNNNYFGIASEVTRRQQAIASMNKDGKSVGENADLRKAEFILDQAQRLATAPSKFDPNSNGLVNFGEGIADNFNRDLIPAVELIRDININNAIVKMNEGKELTEGETALILAYITYGDVQQARQYDLPMGYKAGQGFAESIPFMAEMLLTRGASRLAIGKVIKIMKASGKTIDQINDFAKWMNLGAKGIEVDGVIYGAAVEGAKTTFGGVMRGIGKEVVGTTLQTAAMPSTYDAMVQQNMQTRLATGENEIDNYHMNNLRSFGNSWVQNFTERKGGELIDWGLGKVLPFDKIWHTKIGNQQVANQFFQSPVAETLEEYLAAIINYGRSFNPLYSDESNQQLKQEADEMFTLEGLGTVFLSMLPNTILGGAVNLYGVNKATHDYSIARDKLIEQLMKSGKTESQAWNIVKEIESSSAEELNERLGTLLTHFNLQDEGGLGAQVADEYSKAAQIYQVRVGELANEVAGLTPEQLEEANQEMQSFATQVKQAAVEQSARTFAQTKAGEVSHEDGNVYQVQRADGTTPEGSRMYISAGNVVTTDNGKGQQMIDRTQSSKDVYVTTYDAEGNVNVEHLAIEELDLVADPVSRQQVEDDLYTMSMQEYEIAQQMDAQQAAQEQQVVGEDNGQQPLGVTEGEQERNIEGRQFTNGQQTITASNPDPDGYVTLSAPVTLPNDEVVTRLHLPAFEALMEVDGWKEVTPQPTAQGQVQVQGQQQAPISWGEMDANQATATVVERSKGNKERAKKFAEAQVKVKQKALEDAQKELDKVAETEDIDAFNAAQDKVDAIQAEVDKWTAVANGIDAYNAPVQPSGNISATSASGNGVVTEGTAQAPEVQEPASQEPQQPTQGAQDEQKKITRESVRELLSKEAQEMEEAWNHNEEMDETDATEIAHDIFNVLGSNVHSMMREEIDDYVGEYYPTQATISSETNSEKGKKEREQLKNDNNLKALEDAVKAKQAELDAIVEETRKMIKEICTSPDATAQDIAEVLEALARYESRVYNLHEQSGSMNNYDMLDKYIGTTKAFQKDVKMLYGRKIAMANASAKVKEVIELADNASEVVGDKEKFAGAYKRKEDALNALTLEELEELKDVLRITGMNDFLYQDAENRSASIREDQRRQKQANSLSDIFDNGGTQVERPTKVKPYKYNPFDFATNDPLRPVMGTAYHEDGHVVSTDAHILVAVKQEYDKKLEGKMTDKDGKVVLEGSKFPNWKQVFNGSSANKADVTAINVDDFRSFLEGAKAKLKAEWQAKKDNGEKVGSFKDYLYNKADVMVRTNGGVHAYRLGRLIDFANALSEIGAKEVFFDGRRDASVQPMAAETNQGKAMIMPVLVDNISIEEDGRVVVGNSNTAFLYDLADKNTRMAANNSQNTLQNGNNSVPLQGEKSATQKVIDKIDSKHFPVVVFNKKNYREVMRKAGASEKLIKEVGDVLSDLKPHQVMGGFFDEGMIFIQEQTDLDAVRKAYIHERQHAFNAANEQLLLKMASTSDKSQFAAMIRAMAGNNFYDKYGVKYLVDEFICRAMEIAYSVDTDAELEAELRKIGANDKQIQIIKEINNEQRNDNSLSNARYNSLLNSNDSSRSEQVRRDSQSVSRGVLGQKGNRSSQTSERRDKSGRPSETIGEVAKNFTAEQTLSNAGEQVSPDGVRYNIASNDKVVAARETQLKRSVRNGLLTMNEANEIREFAQAMRVIAETIAQAKKADGNAEFPSFSEWNGLEVQLNANGTPLVSAIKSNGEYPMNIDFAKNCIKRDSTNQVLNKLAQVDPQLFTSLTTDMLVEINQIINKHGLSVPCVGCFVEARRYRSAEYAKSVVETWNTLVDAVNKGDKAITAAKKKLGGKQSVDKIVEHLRNTPSDNVKISESDIISPNKYGELMMKHPSIPTLLQATQGQNNTYLIVPEAIYYGDVLNLSAENSWDVDAAYEVGGVRLQSFSDFKAKLFFDYCQVLADLASKKLPAHSYTKVPSFAELFGLTGMKINLSLYYSGTGLDVDGNYTYSNESISPEFAFDLQSREGYTDNVGTMAIGVSDEHIWKLLKDENIRSISPYHKSGINPEVASKLKADEFVDYTNEQNAVTPKSAKKEGESWQDYYARITKLVDGKVPTIGKKVKPEFNLYDDLIDTNSPIQTARNYVAYCQENGIVPKYASFVYNADGSFNEEYYKLLFDFSVYNKDGVYAPQGAVKWAEGSMPTNTVDILKQALEVEEGTIAKNQAEVDAVVNDILTNVFDRDDLAVSESQVRYSVVTDKKKIEELEASEKMKGYRTVILNEDGTFSSPMATSLGNKGKTSAKTSGFELGKWEQAEERPELADENGKINLKPKDGGDTYVDYNPYIHNRLDKINTQFTSAWRKPFLVYIETEIPMSDINSGYHAEKAALSVGVHPWNGGDLVLSRYDKPVRIVPWDEVADAWAEQFDEVTFDIVNPELLPLLHERGVKILPPKKAAKEKALAAYEQWKAENSKPRFSVSKIAEDAWNKYQYDGELESIRDVANYIEENMPKNEQTQALFDAIDAYNEEEFEDRQLYGMRGDLEPFEDAILEELETLMNSNPRFSVTAAEDKAYADAVARGDMKTAQRMVIEAAKKAMPNTKIVDADGNPMIVYHDTNATELVNIETGENWNDLDWRAKDEWRNREDFEEYWEDRDFYTFNDKRSRRSIEMPAYFFSTKEDEYHEYGNRTIRAFLNITNPAIDPTIEKAGTYDYAGEDAMNRLIEQGHDGFIRTMNNGEWDEVNAFFPNQIKSAEPVTYDDNGNIIPLSERFNDDKKDIRFSLSNTNQRIFVSNAERAVESIKQEKATPQQWKAMIEKQGGLKAGEDKWLGLSEWLDSKIAPAQENETMGDVARRVAKNTITKQEILDYIAEHQIQIEDVAYMDADDVAGIDLTPEQQEKYDQFVDEYKTIQEEDGLSEEDAFEELVDRYGEDFTMAFFVDSEGELQIQGDYDGRTADAALYYLGGEQINVINRTRLTYTTKGLKNNREIALTVPTIERWNADDAIHFGDAGNGRAIAWVRFGETTDADGNRVLVIDEIQSKIHQEGREKGYATKKDRDIKKKIAELTNQQDAIFDAMRAREEGRAGITNFTEEETAELKRLGEEIKQLQSELSANNGIIPDAPFDKNWHELAFKRMLRYAAENGFDYVAWTTGEQQAERYNLGKQFDSIEREDNPSINGRRFALNGANYFTFVVNEEGVITESDMSEIQGKPLADVVGKDLAIRMMSLEDGDAIEGADLRIGGEGMKGFYDRMLPSFVSKYAKKWGAKVQDINLPNLEESAQTMHAVNVTQEMKDSVMEGQVMFSVRNRTEDLRMSEESVNFARRYRWGDLMEDADYIDPIKYGAEIDDFYNAQNDIDDIIKSTPFNEVIDAYKRKAKAVENFLKKLDNSGQKVVVISSIYNMNEELKANNIEKSVRDAIIAEEKALRKRGKTSAGMKVDDVVYVLTENLESLVDVQLTYAHEVQHIENEHNKQLLADIIDVTSPKELNDFLVAIGHDTYGHWLDYKEDGFIALADEVVAYAMEYGYQLGENGNLAEALKEDGLENNELINLLQKEYERRKGSTPFVLVKNQGGNEVYQGEGVGNQNDGKTLRRKPRKMGESRFVGFASSSSGQTRGELTRSIAEQKKLQDLRDSAVSKLLSTTTIDVPDIALREADVRFSVTGAPVPTPDETKREYLKRYMEWRESQRDEQEVAAYEQLLKDMSSQRETLYRQWVDRNRPIEYFQEWLQSRGGKITSYTNAFADMTRSKGRVQTASGEFEVIFNGVEAAIKDIINSKRLKGIHLTWKVKGERNGKQLEPDELIGVYCQAMDVKEAKEKDLSDRGEEGFKKNLRDANGNEVSYEDVIRMVHSALAGTNLKDNLWAAVNEATKFALKYQLAAGMINQKTFDKFNRDYYVPERGWRERDMDGREYHYNEESSDLNGSPYNAALAKSHGRESLASDPFAYIKSIAISSIMSAEKNRTKQIFLQMLLENDEIGNKSGAWKIRRVYLVDDGAENAELSYIKPADESKLINGFPTRDDVKSFEMKLNSDLSNKTKGEKKQHLVSVVRDGVPYLIELESELVARALNRDYPQRDNVNFVDRFVRKITKNRVSMRSLTGFASSINTQHNPEFAPSNFIRDFFFANTKILMEHKDPWEALKKFNKNIAIMLPAVVRYVTTTSAGRRDVAFAESSRGKILKRFFEEGAQTGWSYLEEVNALREKIRKNLYKTKARKIATVPINVVLQMYSFLSEVSELSVRVAMFATEIELGKKPMDAAHNAKEITTNFDTKGEFANEFGVLWSFFNATIQGSNSLYRAVKKGKKRALGVLGGVSAFMFALGYIITILQPDDPDEETMWNDYIRQTNIVIGKYKIPVMHFFRMFYAGGVNLALRHQGRKTKTESYYDAFQAAANEVIPDSPLRVQGFLVYDEKNDKVDWSLENYLIGLTPSIASPMVEAFVTNENFMGGKIDKEPYPNEEGIYKKRHYTKVQDNEDGTRHPYNLVADWISGNTSDNDLVGEDDWSPLVDISGSQLRHIFRGYTGGAGSFSEAAYEFGRKIAEGEELSRDDVPIIRKFTKGYNGESAYTNEFYKLYYDIKDYEQQLKYKKGYDKDAYWEERGSEQYKAYMRLKRLVNRKPKEGETHTPEEVKQLMEANKEWRRLK